MKRNIFGALILFLLLSVVFTDYAFPWAEATHGYLSEYASESSVLNKNKDNYLKNLGFENGLEEYFQLGNVRNKIRDWLSAGAHLEDASSFGFPVVPYSTTRSFNHFHDPLKSWGQAGLNDTWTGVSSLLWAQAGSLQNLFPEGDQSWQKIREHYYTALTGRDFAGELVASSKEKRDEYFARTFKGLGHQIHLIQDTAQPDHVRNDAHPEDSVFQTRPIVGGFYFETWAKERIIL